MVTRRKSYQVFSEVSVKEAQLQPLNLLAGKASRGRVHCAGTQCTKMEMCANLASVKEELFLSQSSVCCSIPPQLMLSEH